MSSVYDLLLEKNILQWFADVNISQSVHYSGTPGDPAVSNCHCLKVAHSDIQK